MSSVVAVACKLVIFCHVLVKILLFTCHKYYNLLPLSLEVKRGKDLYEGNGYLVRSKEELNVVVALPASFLIPR